MGKNWAICIGINDYYNLKPLHYAVQDAASIRDFFQTDIGFEEVFYFADDAPPINTPRGSMRSLPTYANLKRFFRERFKQPFLSSGDNLWFFFAGHGEPHEGHDYLMPIDVDPGNIHETALRVGDITAWLRNCGADNVVLLIDACRQQGRRSGLGLGTEEQQGVITMYSCSPRESSYEIDELQHGAFTYALLEGLRLQGSSNCATVERLHHHLRHRVPSLNHQYRKPVQTPYAAVEPLSKNHFILLPEKATLQDVTALKVDAQAAELEHHLDLAEQLWIRVLSASRADMQAIKALQRIALNRANQSVAGQSVSVPTAGSRRVADSVSEPKPETQLLRIQTPPIPSFEFEVVTVNAHGHIDTRVKKRTDYRREELGSGVTLDLVMVPGGSFMMGSPDSEVGDSDEKPQHEVKVPSFLMGKYAVTQAQWKAVAALPQVARDLEADPSHFKGPNRPVEQVSWGDAVEFCERLSQRTGKLYRLPSEAEWEYACRAGTTTPFHFGETITTDLGNYNGNDTYGNGPKGTYREQTTDVGTFSANAFGLYDMHGNVWEWCLDHWYDNYSGAPTDGSAWLSSNEDSRRLLRGGSWYNYPWSCRSAYRFRNARDSRLDNLGFRVVCGSS
ncbi:MAG: SUMF1/EgtB/PvdO family nonheme iron enzyme [Kaiparowitsia implicata GSE-PSE-MK54-09C]|jgi:formylglycine-generating enzyme required for sulfatase activity|nr:SUMF1/EgtB/PvdO family nonheme iron enzyme [Kaiparowitsia implicata GSE-PSE-MK54-09C]